MPMSVQDSVRLGKKIATGGFGTVYRGDLIDDEAPGEARAVIVKKVHHQTAKPKQQ